LTRDRDKSDGDALKLAVTGGAASGKSAVCRRFRQLGAFVVDLDRLSREALAPGTPGLARVVDRFGKAVLGENDVLNRARLREIIVSDPEARRDLESIVHPVVLEKMNEEMAAAESAGAPLLIAEVPLLYEAGLADGFDRVIVVAASEKERVRRMAARDGVAPDQAAALIGIQMPEAEKKKKADHVIENKGGMAELNEAVDRLFNRLAADVEKDGESA
jgi:dephospho-CoA kinase